MDFEKKLKDVIKNISPQIFVQRLMLFDLISSKENRMLITHNHVNDIDTEISQLLLNKINNDSVYREKFKYFLEYYEDLQSIYVTWKSLSEIKIVFNQSSMV